MSYNQPTTDQNRYHLNTKDLTRNHGKTLNEIGQSMMKIKCYITITFL